MKKLLVLLGCVCFLSVASLVSAGGYMHYGPNGSSGNMYGNVLTYGYAAGDKTGVYGVGNVYMRQDMRGRSFEGVMEGASGHEWESRGRGFSDGFGNSSISGYWQQFQTSPCGGWCR